MKVERLRNILQFNSIHRDEIAEKIRKFYSYVGMNNESEVLNILQIARDSFIKRGFIVLELPFTDEEIVALTYKGDALGYILINTSRPKVHVNFAICHELYHAYFQEKAFKSKVEFVDNEYSGNEEECAANLFAGMLLMPETSFRTMYNKFRQEMKGNEQDTIIQLMHYYKVPYMAALVRCYELGLPESQTISEELLEVDYEVIKKKMQEYWLDISILSASNKDDYAILEMVVERFGKEYVERSYLSQNALDKVLKNMRTIYRGIKED